MPTVSTTGSAAAAGAAAGSSTVSASASAADRAASASARVDRGIGGLLLDRLTAARSSEATRRRRRRRSVGRERGTRSVGRQPDSRTVRGTGRVHPLRGRRCGGGSLRAGSGGRCGRRRARLARDVTPSSARSAMIRPRTSRTCRRGPSRGPGARRGAPAARRRRSPGPASACRGRSWYRNGSIAMPGRWASRKAMTRARAPRRRGRRSASRWCHLAAADVLADLRARVAVGREAVEATARPSRSRRGTAPARTASGSPRGVNQLDLLLGDRQRQPGAERREEVVRSRSRWRGRPCPP